MKDKREHQPILARFRDREPIAPPQPPVVDPQLTIADDPAEGYNPYDKPAPVPRDVDAEKALYRRRRTGT